MRYVKGGARPIGSVTDSFQRFERTWMMPALLAQVRAAVVAAVAVVGLVFVGSALAVQITSFTPLAGLPLTPADGSLCAGGTTIVSGAGFVNDGPASIVSVSFTGAKSPLVQVTSH